MTAYTFTNEIIAYPFIKSLWITAIFHIISYFLLPFDLSCSTYLPKVCIAVEISHVSPTLFLTFYTGSITQWIASLCLLTPQAAYSTFLYSFWNRHAFGCSEMLLPVWPIANVQSYAINETGSISLSGMTLMLLTTSRVFINRLHRQSSSEPHRYGVIFWLQKADLFRIGL